MISTAKTAAGWALRLTALAASLLVVADARAQGTTQQPSAASPSAPQAPAPAQAPPAPQAYPPAPPAAPAPYVTPPLPTYSQQQGYAAQPGLPPPQSAWQPTRPSKGLMITGISILAGSYLLATSIGASLIDEDKYDEDGDASDCRYCDDIAPYLFIPIAGPFVAMSQTPNDGGLLLLGMLEVVGAALTVGGIVRYQNTKRAAAMQGFSSWKLSGRRELALDMSSSLRSAGPRMTLRF